jgi:hypothetical protein
MTRGSLIIKVRLPGCNPIRKASGTHDPAMLKKLVRMVHTLHEQGRDDLVNAIAAGRLKPLQVYSTFRFNRLDDLPHAEELARFEDVWPAWIDMLQGADHRRACRGYCERLAKLMPRDASLAAIVPALKEYRVLHATNPRTFHHAHHAMRALLRDILGRRHRLYHDVADIPALKSRVKRKSHPLTPDQLRELVRRLGEPYGPMAWTMATTGMGWKEYTGPWEREGEGLRIHGTKTGGRDRLIPIVSLLYRPVGTIHPFRYRLSRESNDLTTPYDLRRTFAGIMVEAGIPRPRRKSYMGHAAGDITGLYEAQEVRGYLVRDAEKMREYLGEPIEPPTLRVLRA